MRGPRLVVAVLAATAVAGCLQSHSVGTDTTNPGAAGGDPWLHLTEFPVPLEHDHTQAALHKAASGLKEVAFLESGINGLPDQPVVNLAMAKDTLLASLGGPVGGSLAPPMSLLVADVKDPTHPAVLSVTPFPGGGVESVAISDDARFGFLGTEFTGAVGIWAVDLANPRTPQVMSFTPIPTEGPHTLRYGVVGTHHLVFSAVAHVATALNAVGLPQDPIPGPPDLRVDIFEFNPSQPQLPMTLLSSYQARDQYGVPDEQGGIPIVHDTFLQVHPITGKPLLYVSHWDRGLRILDVSDPSHPEEIGKFTDLAPANILATHTVIPNDGLVDGRHYTVVAPICEYNPDEECYMRVLDTTDPTHPVQAGTWQLPGQVHGAIYTPEIFCVHAGKVYLPYTHAGFWVLDINSTANAKEPKTEAYYFVSQKTEGLGDASGDVPWSNSALVKDGYILVADIYTGIHVLERAN